MNEPPSSLGQSSKTVIGPIEENSPPERDGSVIGPYKLLQKIGEGGFGIVYMAEQEKPVRRTVALKIIKPGMDTSQVIARFESERQALALMDHPNIARVLDAGATGSGHPYFVMELVRGVPITDFCDQNHLSPPARLKLFTDVCHAIQHAHHKGIIHRDIKPSNVLVTLHDGVAIVKVIDFGVAKATVQKLTERTLFTAYGQMIGTPAYMSPEQAEVSGLDIDTRSDVYSLGVLLYELLTGTTPLEAERLRSAGYNEMQRLIREEEPPRPSTRLSSLGDSATAVAGNRGLDVKALEQVLSGDLDWIAMKALEKDRDRRYPTPDSFADDIERYLQQEPILARPPSAAYRLKKFGQRNRGAVLTVAAIVLTLLAATGVSTWEALRAMQAQRAALVAADAERAAKIDAQTREAEAKAILGFVQKRIVAAPRPAGQAGGLGRDVTLRQAIEAALPSIQKSFSDQPLIEAQLRLTLGESFFMLGDRQKAVEQEEAARALFTKARGPDDPETLEAMNVLARSYDGVARHEEALKVNEETLARRKVTLGPDHPDTLESMNNLGSTYFFLGRYDDAIRLYGESAALRKAKLGADHVDTLKSLHNLAMCYTVVGRYAEGAKIYEDLLAKFTAQLGREHPNTLHVMRGLGNCYYVLGRLADALKLREDTFTISKVKLGPDHPDTFGAMYNLALSYDAIGRYADALKLRSEAVARMKATLGPEHPDTLDATHRLAESESRLGHYARAIKLAEETLALQKSKLGADRPATLETTDELAKYYDAVGRHDEALRLREESLPLAKAKLGPRHRDTLIYMGDLANTYAALGRTADALKLREETLALQESTLGVNHIDRLTVLNDQAETDSALARHADALKIREGVLAQYKLQLGPNHPDTLTTMRAVAESLIALDRAAEAVPLIREAANLWDKLARTDPEGFYQAAKFRAVAATALRSAKPTPPTATDADAQANRSIEDMKRALTAGYENQPQLTQEKDFDVLRSRADFKSIVANLERAKQDQSAKHH